MFNQKVSCARSTRTDVELATNGRVPEKVQASAVRPIALIVFVAVLLLGPAIASASAGTGTGGSGGIGAEFGNEIVDMLFGWMRGWLGKTLAAVALIFAGISAVTRGFTIGALTLLGVCILCAFGPDLVDNFFAATLPL